MGQGREAVTVRQAILVILLVGAAFLGGAFVNGPGLQWAQSRVLRLLGLNSVGEIAAVDLETSSNGEVGADSVSIERLETPAATSTSSVGSDDKSLKKDPSNKTSVPQLRPKPARSNLGSDQSRQSVLPSATSPHSVTKSSAGIVAPLDQNVILARGDSRVQPSPGSKAPAGTVKGTAVVVDSLAGLLPPGENPPTRSVSPPVQSLTGPKSSRVADDEWTLLESKMQTLGVSRFTIEGKPGGAIVFACLIPVAGRQAVSERFEAEGDDVIHAAQSVLRRIVLWRATQAPHGE
jgi:hypothetical protein